MTAIAVGDRHTVSDNPVAQLVLGQFAPENGCAWARCSNPVLFDEAGGPLARRLRSATLRLHPGARYVIAMSRSSRGAGGLFGVLGCLMSCGFPRPGMIVDDAGDTGSADARDVGGIDSGVDAVADALVPDAFVAPPLVTAFSPGWGSTRGGTRVRVLGLGFTGPGLAVKFGTVVARNVTIVSDTELTLTTPVGPHAPVDLVVTTQGGTAAASNKYRYLAPLYAADARGTTPGSLYIVDPTNGASVAVGGLGVAMTGMALSSDGILYGATVAKLPAASSLVTIDPYSARVSTIAPLVTTNGDATHTPDLAFVGARLFGISGKNVASINTTTARVSPISVEVVGGGMGLVSSAPDTLLIAQGPTLATVNTASFAKSVGPSFSRGLGVNALTYVGSMLYGAESTSLAPTSTLVTINPANGAMAVVGQLPNNIDAIAGIPTQTAQSVSPATSPYSETPLPRGDSLLPPTYRHTIRIAKHTVPLREFLSYGGDVQREGAPRRVVPLRSLARLGLGERVVLVSASGDVYATTLNAPGMALTTSPQHGLKLFDLRSGFQKIFGEIVEIRTALP